MSTGYREQFTVTGPAVDNGDWVLVPVQRVGDAKLPPDPGDFLGVSWTFSTGITGVYAGEGLVGGGSSGDVTLAIDASHVVLASDPRLTNRRAPVDGSVTSSSIASGAVTYSKIQNVSASGRLLGRASVGAGPVEEIVCSAFGRSLLDDLDAAAARDTLQAAPLASPSFSGDVSLSSGGVRITRSSAPFVLFTEGASAVAQVRATANQLRVTSASGVQSQLVVDVASNRVGIGTDVPAALLHVNGSILAASLTDGTTTKTMTEVLASGGGGASVSSIGELSDVRGVSFTEPWYIGGPLVYQDYGSGVRQWGSLGDTGRMRVPVNMSSLAYDANSLGYHINQKAPKDNPQFTGVVRADSLTDGTTTKTVTEILSGAKSLADLSDTTVATPVQELSFLIYSGGTWRDSRVAGALPLGVTPIGGWSSGSVGAALALKANSASPALTGSASISTSSGVPLAIFNTGSSNSFEVHDAAPDSTPFVIDANGRVGIGLTAPLAELHVNGTVRCSAFTDGGAPVTASALLSSVSNARRASHIDQKLTPTTATAGGEGALYWDDNYIYVRTSAGWKRAQLLGLNEAPPSGGGYDQVKLTQAQYDALAVKDPDTLYVIVP